MKKFLTIIGIFGGLTLSHAQSYVATLNGLQEVPPNNAPGFGLGRFTLSGTTFNVTSGFYYQVELYGVGNYVLLNEGAPGVNGSVLFALKLDTPNSINGTFSGSGTLNSLQIADLNKGDLYVTIGHSLPDGFQIRGQIEMVPESSTLALIGTGSLTLLARRRRLV